jgi:hypothetical protein
MSDLEKKAKKILSPEMFVEKDTPLLLFHPADYNIIAWWAWKTALTLYVACSQSKEIYFSRECYVNCKEGLLPEGLVIEILPSQWKTFWFSATADFLADDQSLRVLKAIGRGLWKILFKFGQIIFRLSYIPPEFSSITRVQTGVIPLVVFPNAYFPQDLLSIKMVPYKQEHMNTHWIKNNVPQHLESDFYSNALMLHV